MNVNLYPCCCATPAHTTFAEAPIKVPFPPKQAPNANAQTSGCIGRANSSLLLSDMTILIIIVVSGMLSTKADAKADT